MTKDLKEETDEELARLVQKGDSEVFALLVQRYETKLMRYAQRFLNDYSDAEDGVQEIFIKIYQNINSFDSTRKFSSWAYRIAHNELINILKKKRTLPLPFFDPDTLFPHPVAKENPVKDVEQLQLRQALDNCLNQVPPKYREPLVLFYLQELSYKEIADVMRIPISTVGVRIKRGKDIIRLICQQQGHVYE